jgi:hypothetical protein
MGIARGSSATEAGVDADAATDLGSERGSEPQPSGPPLDDVAPSRRNNGLPVESDVRTTTWRTASCPRSIDWATSAVPIVAAADPMATPTMVPLTPNAEAISAARTAPAAEARI